MSIQTYPRPTQAPSQANCAPVGAEFGTPPNQELLNDPNIAEVIEEVGDRLGAAHPTNSYAGNETVRRGQEAALAIKAIGCTACELSNTCAVQTNLEERVSLGQKTANILEKTEMIGNAPTWLSAARLQTSGMTSKDIRTLVTDWGAAQEAIQDGTLDRFIGATTNRAAKPVIKAQLPELAAIGSIPKDKPLRSDIVTVKTGKTFTVVDASVDHGSKDSITDESRKEYGILCAKLVERMGSDDRSGDPQIFHQDQKMQKTIRRLGDAELYEMRMSGKNRLYFTVTKTPDDESGSIGRIVILGAHGGDASTQRKFIDVSLSLN